MSNDALIGTLAFLLLTVLLFAVLTRPFRRRRKKPRKDTIICPHCQIRGSVRTAKVKRKRGVSGGKATAAVLTLGWSMLATGLSRKEMVTHAACGNCGSEWDF